MGPFRQRERLGQCLFRNAEALSGMSGVSQLNIATCASPCSRWWQPCPFGHTAKVTKGSPVSIDIDRASALEAGQLSPCSININSCGSNRLARALYVRVRLSFVAMVPGRGSTIRGSTITSKLSRLVRPAVRFSMRVRASALQWELNVIGRHVSI